MTKPFSTLLCTLSNDAQEEVSRRVDEELKQMSVHVLHDVHSFSPKVLTKTPYIQQPTIANMEQRIERRT